MFAQTPIIVFFQLLFKQQQPNAFLLAQTIKKNFPTTQFLFLLMLLIPKHNVNK